MRELLENITNNKQPITEAKKPVDKVDAKDVDKKDDAKDDKKDFFNKFKKKGVKESISESEYIAFLEELIETTLEYSKENLHEAANEYYDVL